MWPCVPVVLTAMGGLAIVVRSMALLFGFLITVKGMTPRDRLMAFHDFTHAVSTGWKTAPRLLGQPRLEIESDDKGNDRNAGLGQNKPEPSGPTLGVPDTR